MNYKSTIIVVLLFLLGGGALAPLVYAQETTGSSPGLESRLAPYASHWCYPYLKDLAEQGYINGDEKGNYNLDNQITIGEFLTVLSQIDEADFAGQNLNWKERTVLWARQQEVTSDALLMDFDRSIKRGEAVALLATYLNLDQTAETLRPYSHQVKDYLDMENGFQLVSLACYREGIMTGDRGYLRAADTLQRSEAFVLFGRVLHPELREPASIAPVFYAISVPQTIQQQMRGVTYHETALVTMADLRYLKMSYVDFAGTKQVGEMIVHRLLAQEVLEIFQELYANQYPIERMVLPDAYNGSDEQSMQDNNTSAFNDRTIANSTSRSNHQLGLAIDINPLYNPYYNSKSKLLQPYTAGDYLDRSKNVSAYIQKHDVCYNAFVSRGWTWGGDWSNPKDYQHFEKSIL